MPKYPYNYFLLDPVVTDIQQDSDKIAVTLHDDERGVQLRVLFSRAQVEQMGNTFSVRQT
jgi:hypothetical protein